MKKSIFETRTVYYSSNPVDIFYLTGKKVWKEKLFLYEENPHLIEAEGEILEFLKGIVFDQIGVDFSKLTHKEFLQLQKWVGERPLVDENPIADLRMVKDEDEIKALRASAKLNYEALVYVRNLLHEGITEREVAWAFEKYAREKGASRMAFDPIVGFEEHTALPHHKPTDRKLAKGDRVILDVGLVLSDYASDLTRTFFFEKSENDKMEELVKEAHQIALEMCKPGADFFDVQEKVDHFFKKKDVYHLRKHTIGHGVGLEVHEHPFVWSKEKILSEGMVITIEPGLYELGKFGYRYEDTILITKKGFENFYESGIRTR